MTGGLCPPTREVEVRGARIAVHEEGRGEPCIVLLHGFGAAMHSWAAILAPLAEHRHCIAFDRPGFGASALPTDPATRRELVSVQGSIEVTLALLDACGVDRAVLVGHSQGGALAAEIALDVPDRVAALVLVDAAVGAQFSPHPAAQRVATGRAGAPVGRAVAALTRALAPRVFPIALHLVYHDPGQVPHQILDEYRALLDHRTWQQTPWELVASTQPTGLPDRVRELTCPTLVMTGAHDRVVPTRVARRLADLITGAHLVVIPGAGHNPHEERPAEVVAALRPFLGSLEA